jgi:zinc transport system permease protein
VIGVPSVLELDFMRTAYAAGAAVGVLAPAVGFFVVQRRMSLIGDGLGHTAFAGVAAGTLLGLPPVATALVATVGGAVGIEWLRSRRPEAGDQALALLFYTGLAAGVVLASAAGSFDAGLFAFLFGAILTVTTGDLLLIVFLGTIAVGLMLVLYRALAAVVIDEEGAEVSGVPVAPLNILVAALVGVTVGVSMRVVGILLVAALMVLPVVAASRLARSLRGTFLLSIGLGVVSAVVGLTVAYYANLAAGGTIVLVAGALAVGAAVWDALRSS